MLRSIQRVGFGRPRGRKNERERGKNQSGADLGFVHKVLIGAGVPSRFPEGNVGTMAGGFPVSNPSVSFSEHDFFSLLRCGSCGMG
jgi:hypothetical protein